ncbi:hypothetical protein [Luteimonas saliphila]|uniref:hypothetical protein n=1 Tax=Luteimonas saliphila TaxID=2804919 RepID=UPI00192E1B2E|nr:hypothetical protein [Luteimonas saliphila]
MDVQTKRPPRDRPVFIDIMIIGAVIAALMFAGLKLLGETHLAWNERYGDVPAAEPPPPPPAPAMTQGRAWTAADDAEYLRLKAEAAERGRRYEEAMRDTRCINGTRFKIEGSTYTSVGRC